MGNIEIKGRSTNTGREVVGGKGKMPVDLGKLVGGEKSKTNFSVLSNILSSVPEFNINGNGQKKGGEVASGIDLYTVTFEDGSKKILQQSVIKNIGKKTIIKSRVPSVIEQIAIASFEMDVKPIEIEQKSSTDKNGEAFSDGGFVSRRFDLGDPDIWKVVVDKAEEIDPLFKEKSWQQIGEVLRLKSGLAPKGEIYNVK